MNYLRVRARRAFIHSSMLCTSLLCNNCSLLQLVLSISILFLPSRESMDKCAKCHCHANCAGECISCQITEQGRLIRECRHRREVPCPQTLHKHLIQRRGNGTAPHAEGPGVWYNTWECTITPRWEELFSLPLRFVYPNFAHWFSFTSKVRFFWRGRGWGG